jgi:hypothetical protein
VIKKIFGENRVTDIITGLFKDNTIQTGLIGAGIGFSLGGPIGALVGFMVGSIGNYVYKHWDDIVKLFKDYVSGYSLDSLKESYNKSVREIDKINENIKIQNDKYNEKMKELGIAIANKDDARANFIKAEMSGISDTIKMYDADKIRIENEKVIAERKIKIAESNGILSNIFSTLDWLFFGLPSMFLDQWLKFKAYINETFSPEKIYKKMDDAISTLIEDLVNTITSIPKNLLKSAGQQVALSLGLITPEQIAMASREEARKEQEEKERVQSAKMAPPTITVPISQADGYVKMIEENKYKQELRNTRGPGPLIVAPQTSSTNAVNNSSTYVSGNASPIDPKKFVHWSTGGGF